MTGSKLKFGVIDSGSSVKMTDYRNRNTAVLCSVIH